MRRMSAWMVAAIASVGVLIFAGDAAAQSKSRPASATAQCKDGTYSSAKTERGACSSHGGVKTWWGDEKPTTASAQTNAPANATGRCKDGSYTTASTQRGACSGHGGVATWMATAATTPSTERPPAPAAPPPAAAPAKTPTRGSAAGTIQQPPADAPPNATAQCNDGTYSFAKQHSGACSSHKGVKAWFK